MTPDSTQDPAELFETALDLDPSKRAEFLDEACANNAALRAEVESLLAADEKATEFLASPLRGVATQHAKPESAASPVGKQIGRYRILGIIGSGGMGTVFEAEQKRPKRRVALKMLHPGLAMHGALQRFAYEAEILGRLRHPGIAQIFEAGTHGDPGGLPYFAMEYVPGARTITQYAREEALSTRQRLALFAKVCDAVHHGHQRGVIHRDLKPGNILVDESGQPKVIDFGVARATDADITIATLQTDVGQLIGTLRYMSPEQCQGPAANIDTRCDVYALGVVLYRMLTGELPYDFTTVTPFEIPRVICEEEPRRLSTINVSLRGDVETIVLKAIEKDCDRRYQSAHDLAQDLRRHLSNEPIEAKRDRTWYVLAKTLSRHRLTAAVAAAFLLLVTVSAITLGLLYQTADTQRALAEDTAEALRVSAYFNTVALAQTAFESANTVQLNELLGRCPSDLRGWEWYHLKHRADDSTMTLRDHAGHVVAVDFSPNGKWIASGGDDGIVRLWDAADGALLRKLAGHETVITDIAFSSDGSTFVTGSYDGTARVWDAVTGEALLRLVGHQDTVTCVAYSSDDQRIISGDADGRVRVWETSTGALLSVREAHEAEISALAGGDDGEVLVTGGTDGIIKLWDAANGRERLATPAHDHRVSCLALSPDGKHVYSGSWDRSVKVWDIQTGGLVMPLVRNHTEVNDIDLAPDGGKMALADATTLQLVDVASGRILRRFLGHQHSVNTVAFSPDQANLVSASHDGTVRVWDAVHQRGAFVVARGENHVGALACGWGSDESAMIAFSEGGGGIVLYDARSDKQVATLRGHNGWVHSLAFSPDGRWLVSGGSDRLAKIWDCSRQQELTTLEGHEAGILSVAWSPDGALIATGSWDGSVRLWRADTGAPIRSIEASDEAVWSVAFSPAGLRLVTAARDLEPKIWDAATGNLLMTLAGHVDVVRTAAYSPDGSHIVTGSDDWTLIIWDAETGQATQELKGHRHRVLGAIYSPDGSRIVSASYDRSLRVWDAATGQHALTLSEHSDPVTCVAFTPDGRRIVSGSDDNTVRVWETGRTMRGTESSAPRPAPPDMATPERPPKMTRHLRRPTISAIKGGNRSMA